MKEINYWQQFMNTGSINDYLNYRNSCNDINGGDLFSGERASGSVRDVGVNSYAGVCSSNGNNFKDGACR